MKIIRAHLTTCPMQLGDRSDIEEDLRSVLDDANDRYTATMTEMEEARTENHTAHRKKNYLNEYRELSYHSMMEALGSQPAQVKISWEDRDIASLDSSKLEPVGFATSLEICEREELR